MGRLSPLRLYPVPLKLACETITLDPPVLLNFSGKTWLLPTGTFPKLKLDGLATRAPAATPIPETAATRVGLDALLVIVRLTLSAAAEGGENTRLNAAVWPPCKVRGKVRPRRL